MKFKESASFIDKPMAIIGAGTLGRRIALMLATRGAEVRIYDPKDSVRTEAVSFVKENIQSQVEKTYKGKAGKAVSTSTMKEAVEDAWLIIEAVPENVELKRKVLHELDDISHSEAIIASNSSSFPSSELIDKVSRPERVLSAHFYMPPRVTAVELMSCGKTDPILIQKLIEVFPLFGLQPFHVREESVGLIFNRIWAAIKRESLYVVAQGVSTPSEVDDIFKLVTGASQGPFRNMDQVGLDVVLAIEEHYAELRSGLPEEVRTLLKEYITKGWLGVKAGRGFYDNY
ncbi:3-hydroxyacyl-CoA dehydrogenase family protein [Acinetobacter baumannii]|nr:3-hydroxyacyl-CoA dehydrogenase family protein [Acinetobacter baumannii]